jgi:hypothetical protein
MIHLLNSKPPTTPSEATKKKKQWSSVDRKNKKVELSTKASILNSHLFIL